MRNQRPNASQATFTSSNLADAGWVAVRTPGPAPRCCGDEAEGTPWRVNVASREATVKGCGVAVAMPQGHSWTPPPSNGSRVNVGTIPVVPSPVNTLLASGKTRCRLMPPGWDGGPVVVCGRESRLHGEGVQRVRSLQADREGRR